MKEKYKNKNTKTKRFHERYRFHEYIYDKYIHFNKIMKKK